MSVIYLLLLAAAAFCFAVAAFTAFARREAHYWGWVALGLLCWVFVPLIQHARGL